MSALLYPGLPGLTFDSIRSYKWSTGIQTAVSGKASTIAYMAYPLVHYELTYEFLRDSLNPSELKALVGLHTQLQVRFDTFLYSDPDFNTIPVSAPQFFGTGNGTAGPFQLVAAYQNTGGPGIAEIVQNLNGTPVLYDNGSTITATNYSIGATGLVTFNAGHFPVTGHTLTWSGSFYYRCRFDDDALPWKKFMNQTWSAPKVGFTSVLL